MGKYRRCGTQRIVQQNLPRCVGQVVLTSDDMADPVANVIDNVTEEIEWFAIGADNDKVFNVCVGSGYMTQHLVIVCHFSNCVRDLETYHIGSSL